MTGERRDDERGGRSADDARPIRVLVVDDSPSVRAVLRRFLARAPGIAVVGEAEDGVGAVEAARRLAPDVLLLDLVLPKLDGFGVLARLAEEGAVPTVILTSRADRSEVRAAFEAFRSGAVDLLPKPDDPDAWRDLAAALPDILRAASRRVVGAPAPSPGRRSAREIASAAALAALPRDAAQPARSAPPPTAAPNDAGQGPLRWLGLGASTGGPGALRDLLATMGAPLPLTALVVQHIAAGFENGLADWLAGSLGLDVRVALHGELAPPGSVRVAPAGVHLRLGADGRLELDATTAARRGHRPSVDELFFSLAAHAPAVTAAALLSGMGIDGAAGLAELHRRGAYCLVQDRATSAVFGMPRAALELGAADAELPPRELGLALAARTRSGRAGERR